MESTFITILDSSSEARILYTSESITDILGWAPEDVVGKSCFDFFHPQELPLARTVHGDGLSLDKAAVLSYCQIQDRNGAWVGCECCFSIVYNVLVACTSIYRRGIKSQKRAVEAPIIQRLFSTSPADPRYHMLSLLSSKFIQGPVLMTHEPRAALFLNRFTRTLAITYATQSVVEVLGIAPNEIQSKSFYECIQQSCLQDAISCLEGAKGNDSIAYMRFLFRDPRADENDDSRSETSSSEDDEEGGVQLGDLMDADDRPNTPPAETSGGDMHLSSGNSTDQELNSSRAIFGHTRTADSSATTLQSSPQMERRRPHNRQRPPRRTPLDPNLEVEAVVSCTSDGLVVILRRARPMVPMHDARNGLFASPWAANPVVPRPSPKPQGVGLNGNNLSRPFGSSLAPQDEFMSSIREVAVFAWSLTGINGSLAKFGRGTPMGESQPPDGLPVWDSRSSRGQSTNDHSRPLGAPVDMLKSGTTGASHRPTFAPPDMMNGMRDTGDRSWHTSATTEHEAEDEMQMDMDMDKTNNHKQYGW
ncbi:MAG: hypothetical protein M1833_004039 [Piccolia ochrophora]|nr:MAG: hypothetical protein M1833_004039 [Piccolia ochrophora]